MVRSFAEIVSQIAMRAHLSASEDVVVGLIRMRAVVRGSSIGANALSAVEAQTDVRDSSGIAALLLRTNLSIKDNQLRRCENVRAQRWFVCQGC